MTAAEDREHMRDCEARELLKWTKDKRLEYYKAIAKRRGAEAEKDLIRRVKIQWALQQEKSK